MDKQEATDFILNRLACGHNKSDIAIELSERMGVPLELIKRFITQVSGTYNPVSHQVSQTNSDSVITNQPPDLLATNHEIKKTPVDPDFSPAIEIMKNPFQVNSLADSLWEEIPSQIDLNILKTYVLESTKKHRRYSDIVQGICEKTDWHWKKAQRFVAKTQTENHEVLQKHRRIFLIPFSVIFILGGMLLMVWSVLSLIDYYGEFTGQNNSVLPFSYLVLVLSAFFTSFGIIAGGIFGLYKTLTNQ